MLRKISRIPLDLVRLAIWTLLRDLLQLLPTGALPCVEGALTSLAHQTLRARREIIRAELRKSYGAEWDEERIHRVAREGFRVYVGTQVRNMFLSRITPQTVETNLPIEGLSHIDEALRKGKGAVLLNPHFGPYMLIMPALGHRGYRIHQVALHGDTPEGRSWLDRKVHDAKFSAIQGQMPAQFINVAVKANVRQAIRALARDEIVLLPSTGREGLEWAQVRFMNREISLNTGVIKMAQMTGAVCLPVFLIAQTPFARVVVESPLGVEGRAPEEVLQEYADRMSHQIEKRPCHFCTYLFEMAVHAHWDDHPFFVA